MYIYDTFNNQIFKLLKNKISTHVYPSPQASHDPQIFLWYSKHYAMQILLHYLVEEKGVSRNDLLDYYVEERGASPQVDVFFIKNLNISMKEKTDYIDLELIGSSIGVK